MYIKSLKKCIFVIDFLTNLVILGKYTNEDFRDNVSGLEVDSILEFNDGNYAAVEIKLGFNEINDAKSSLLKFYENVSKKPIFMCVIVSNTDIIVKDRETGIYILPITALRP